MKRKRNPKARRSGARVLIIQGHDGVCARYGYWTPRVQSIVRRWRRRLTVTEIKELFPKVAMTAFERQPPKANMSSIEQELDKAVRQVLKEDKTARWLLLCNLTVMTNERCDSWKQIQEEMKRLSGHYFDVRTIRQTATRLHLTMSPKSSASFINSRQLIFPS